MSFAEGIVCPQASQMCCDSWFCVLLAFRFDDGEICFLELFCSLCGEVSSFFVRLIGLFTSFLAEKLNSVACLAVNQIVKVNLFKLVQLQSVTKS